MKIVKIDNFDRDHIDDVVIAENVSEYYAKVIVAHLNQKFSGDNSQDYFVVKPDDYKPRKFTP